MKGIYLLRIGQKKYVGKSICIGSRAIDHQNAINRALKAYSYWKNIGFDSDDKRKSNASYIKVAQYLHENPRIETGTIEVLQRQVCSNMLYFAEDYFLNEIYPSADCYNTAPGSTRPDLSKDHFWDAKVVEDRIEYFDPRMPHLRVISSKTPKDNKLVIEKINEIKASYPHRIKLLMQWRERVLAEHPEYTSKQRLELMNYVTEQSRKIMKKEI